MKDKTSESHDEVMRRRLRENPKFAAEYLKAALEDAEEPRVLLNALRRIAEARGGIAKVAKAAGIERESLYRALSAKGNPRLSTLVAVTKAVGLKLTVENALWGLPPPRFAMVFNHVAGGMHFVGTKWAVTGVQLPGGWPTRW